MSAPRLTLAASALLLGPAALPAQERLLDAASLGTSVVVENWSLPTAAEVATSTGSPMYVRGLTQLTIPLAAVVPVAAGWSADVYAAYAVGTVRLARPDQDGLTELRLSGVTDSHVRLVGHLAGDLVTVTLGASAPTGKTALTSTQLDALSVLASPALGLRTPGLGEGAGGTAGVVLAHDLGAWSGALGGSFEYRGSFSPTAAAEQGIITGTLRPGNMLHLTAGAARVAGALRHTLNLAADLSTSGALHVRSGGVDGNADFGITTAPSLTGLYELDVVRASAEAATYVLARHHGRVTTGGNVYPGTGRNEFMAGTQLAWTVAPRRALRWSVDGRYQSRSTDLQPDAVDAPSPFATAGVASVGSTLAWHAETARQLAIEPFVRAQVGRLDFGSEGGHVATGTAAGLTISTRF